MADQPPVAQQASQQPKPSSALSKEEVERSLDYSIKDGSAYSVMVGFGETYLVPFALKFGATNSEIGFLAAIPQLMAAIAQQISAVVTERTGKRKDLMVTFAFLQGLVWLPLILTPFLFQGTPVFFVILFACFYWFFGSFAALPWASLMGDIVPSETRGSFFGKRNEITGFAALASSIIAGSVLGLFDSKEQIQALGFAMPAWLGGFVAIFSIAFVARMVSVRFLAKMTEPAYASSRQSQLSLVGFITRIRKENFGKFTLYAAATQFATTMAGPFFTVYVLQTLKFDYWTFAVYLAAFTFTQFISMPYWGKLADRFGNKTVLNVAGLLLPAIPVLWVLSANQTYLMLIHAFSGFVWAGFNLLTFNYVIDATEPATRPRYIAHYNFVNNTAIFAGAMTGGFLATFFADKTISIGILAISGLPLLFLLSGILRAIVAALLLPKVRETRLRYDINEHEFFWKVTAIYPLQGMMQHLEGAWHLGEGAVKESAKTVKKMEEKTAQETIKLGEKLKRGLSKKQ